MSRGTRVPCPESPTHFAYGTITLYGGSFQILRLWVGFVTLRSPREDFRQGPTTPLVQRSRPWHTSGLGSSPFARHYSGNRGFFLFLEVLRCFTSLRSPRAAMYSPHDTVGLPQWVSPFGDPRIKACLRLPEAYRSLPRPSSPHGAKASTVHP